MLAASLLRVGGRGGGVDTSYFSVLMMRDDGGTVVVVVGAVLSDVECSIRFSDMVGLDTAFI